MFLTAFSDWLNGAFAGFDGSIFRFTYELEESFNWLRGFARFISYFGDKGLFVIISGIILLVFRKTRKAGILMLLAVLVSFIVNDLILKNWIARPRHFWDMASPYYEMWVKAGSNYHSSYSFPSGHTNIATVFGVSMFLSFNKKYSFLFLLFPLMMAWSRVALFVHYPSDVIAGLLSGTFSTIISFLIANQLYKIKFIDKLTTGDNLF